MYNILDNEIAVRRQKVLEGINILLALFSTVKQQRLFPRKIMTKKIRGQVTVYSIEQMMKAFEDANFEDCRINAYPYFLNEAEERDYDNEINLDIFAPNILFIDLDQKDFSSKSDLDKTLNKILKHISKVLHDSKPLLLWSGNGYHIIIPVESIEALEHFEDFKGLTDKPSSEFLQFAKSFLSLNKADKANNPAFKSCLLRVPYTFNSKCFIENVDPEVKLLQEFDSSKPLPRIDNLLVEFVTFLIDRKLKIDLQTERYAKEKVQSNDIQSSKPITSPTSTAITYVEKLLKIGISDYRKNAIGLILAPYFVNILKLSDDESFIRIKDWALKCNNINALKPSIKDFDIIIKNAIKRAKVTGIKPLKFNDTLQFKNKKLYDIILSSL
jgi:Primase X